MKKADKQFPKSFFLIEPPLTLCAYPPPSSHQSKALVSTPTVNCHIILTLHVQISRV